MTENEPPGLQPERTVLAWRRTALSSVTVSAIAGREIARHPSIPTIAVFAALLATTVGIALGALVRHRRFIVDAKDSRAVPFYLMVALTAGVVLAGLCAGASLR
ncbi:DUF202 domain-containing protein [Rhodococcus sp. NPDC056743]|uniref:DUF202 domain-containing protein n=1 Tax=Rhodococcus sp. NPDC056743 TaxID=3345934 RepID=UPI00366DB6BB